MNISLCIPKGKKIKSRLEKELSLCKNIQDKTDRSSIERGLKAILANLSDGMCYIWNGTDLWSIEYPLNEFIYYCGKDFKVPEAKIGNKYMLVALDAKECTIGILEGNGKITVVWHDTSIVPGKVDGGGQSKRRYQQNRDNMLKKWYRDIAEKMKDIYYRGV